MRTFVEISFEQNVVLFELFSFTTCRGTRASLVAQLVENPPAMRETWVWSLSWEDSLEEGKALHSSILAWRIPWTMERLKEGGEGDDRGWDGWMESLTQWTWVWVNFGSWWWTGMPGMLQSMESQKFRQD